MDEVGGIIQQVKSCVRLGNRALTRCGGETGAVEEGKRGKHHIAYCKPDGKQKWEENQYHGIIVVLV